MENTEVKEMFICSTCGEEKPISEKNRAKYSKQCKDCVNEQKRKRAKERSEKLKEIEQGEPIHVPVPPIDMNKAKSKKETSTKKQSKNTQIKQVKEMSSGVLQAVFGVVSVRAGEHWQLSQKEADSISEPLINILNKYDAFSKVSENMDSINLFMALSMTIIPRALTSVQENKSKKEGKTNVTGSKERGTNTQYGTKKEENKPSNKTDNRNSNTPDSYIFASDNSDIGQPAIL